MNKSRHYDLIVAGGGVAGVAAALEAARAGLRVALVEKTIITGGLATAGLVNIYLPLCDGCGHQVTFGIAEELLQLSLRYGPGNVPADWRTNGQVWEIPYGTLLPRKANGLLAAGRCIASEGDAWEVTRVIPIAALTGQAAGAAATLAVRRGTTLDALDPKDVQAVLRQKRIPYHLTDL